MLSTSEIVLLAAAGVPAGAGNAAAGGGSLPTFPLLVGFGIPPLTADVTNTLDHGPGYISIVAGLREELAGQRRWVILLTSLAVAGAVLFACVLLALQPLLRARLSQRHGGSAPLSVLVGYLLWR